MSSKKKQKTEEKVTDPLEIKRANSLLSKRVDKKPFIRKFRDLHKVLTLRQIANLSGVPKSTIERTVYTDKTERIANSSHILMSKLHSIMSKALKDMAETRETIQRLTNKKPF